MSNLPVVTPEVDRLARRLWEYHRLDHRRIPSDVILALGSNDPRVAEHAARLWLDGLAPWLVCSGDVGALTAGLYGCSEARAFADIAIRLGVPADRILLEERATNTGENVRYARELLAARGIPARSIIAVQKPYMERRTFATIRKVWPEPMLAVSSPPLSWDDYPMEPHLGRARVIEIMVGDLERILVYPARGFQIEQVVPPDVHIAWQRLIELGFNGHRLPAGG